MKKTLVFLSLLVSLFMAGCSNEPDQVKNTVLTYNATLVEAYGKGDLSGLTSLVTPEQAEILSDRIRDLARNRLQLTATLRSLHFSDIQKKSAEEREVVTEESWDFRYVNVQSGKKISELSPHYIGRYSLMKKEGRWLVAHVDVQPVEVSGEKADVSGSAQPVGELPAGDGLSPEELLKNTVLTYLTLLADGYRNQNMTPLLHSATQKRAEKAYHHMSSMGEGKVKMNPQLLEIEMPSVLLVAEDRADVKALEHWEYVYYRTDTGMKVYENKVFYDLTYMLVRDMEGRWLVDDISIEKTEEGEGIGELRFYKRPPDHPPGQP